tara:strand:+ start:1346 stop:1513 length:168 start_codon:yes stop_codon:yes gene_type:complete
MKRWQGLLLALFIVIALGIVGEMDYQDELAAEQHYKDMVCAGHYPDYKGTEPSCN